MTPAFSPYLNLHAQQILDFENAWAFRAQFSIMAIIISTLLSQDLQIPLPLSEWSIVDIPKKIKENV